MVYMGVYVAVFLYAEYVYVFAGGPPFYNVFVFIVSQGRGFASCTSNLFYMVYAVICSVIQ